MNVVLFCRTINLTITTTVQYMGLAEKLLMILIGAFFVLTIIFLIGYAIKQPYSLANLKKNTDEMK